MCSLKHSLKHYQFFFNFEFALDYLRLKKTISYILKNHLF